jgi:hypothetical protein
MKIPRSEECKMKIPRSEECKMKIPSTPKTSSLNVHKRMRQVGQTHALMTTLGQHVDNLAKQSFGKNSKT